ncbi:stalk domain-containing protein [Anaerovorax odorimutans]|uniref:stalk domain-containing protein n=1 Tax=Anaerovorax odorimutans TaxID=109327 RepID=UPI0004038949|nr:stalk domain-containing protein [Anaerovorax odorimutans]
MKKVLIGVLCATTIMSTGIISFASETSNILISSNTVVLAGQQSVLEQYKIKINDKYVELGNCKVIKIKDQIMVPLRIISESLGFKVTWDKDNKMIHLDDGIMQSDISIGVDNYSAYSSKAIGMTSPESLGVAPTIVNGCGYVPVNYYKTLLTDSQCVKINGNEIAISYNSVDDDVTQDSTQIPNPLVDYQTIDEARKAVGFNFFVPSDIPSEYQMKDIIVISNELAEIFYKQGDNEILYRTAKGKADISGDYNTYSKTNIIPIGDMKVTIKGNDDNISLATWSNAGISFSLAFDVPVNQKTLADIIESIK